MQQTQQPGTTEPTKSLGTHSSTRSPGHQRVGLGTALPLTSAVSLSHRMSHRDPAAPRLEVHIFTLVSFPPATGHHIPWASGCPPSGLKLGRYPWETLSRLFSNTSMSHFCKSTSFPGRGWCWGQGQDRHPPAEPQTLCQLGLGQGPGGSDSCGVQGLEDWLIRSFSRYAGTERGCDP